MPGLFHKSLDYPVSRGGSMRGAPSRRTPEGVGWRGADLQAIRGELGLSHPCPAAGNLPATGFDNPAVAAFRLVDDPP